MYTAWFTGLDITGVTGGPLPYKQIKIKGKYCDNNHFLQTFPISLRTVCTDLYYYAGAGIDPQALPYNSRS